MRGAEPNWYVNPALVIPLLRLHGHYFSKSGHGKFNTERHCRSSRFFSGLAGKGEQGLVDALSQFFAIKTR